MRWGVYVKVEGRTGVGQYYQFVGVARHHTTGEEAVVYIPLRVELGWAGTVRYCFLEKAAFQRKFQFVSEGLPPLPFTDEVMRDAVG
jgi:hypothetical protein